MVDYLWLAPDLIERRSRSHCWRSALRRLHPESASRSVERGPAVRSRNILDRGISRKEERLGTSGPSHRALTARAQVGGPDTASVSAIR